MALAVGRPSFPLGLDCLKVLQKFNSPHFLNCLQLEDKASLLACPYCNLLHYCSKECQEEHWVKASFCF